MTLAAFLINFDIGQRHWQRAMYIHSRISSVLIRDFEPNKGGKQRGTEWGAMANRAWDKKYTLGVKFADSLRIPSRPISTPARPGCGVK